VCARKIRLQFERSQVIALREFELKQRRVDVSQREMAAGVSGMQCYEPGIAFACGFRIATAYRQIAQCQPAVRERRIQLQDALIALLGLLQP
jgi:hypothetical protein